MGISTQLNLLSIKAITGIEYINFNSYGTIHEENNNTIITEQSNFSIPIGLVYEHKINKIKFVGEIGYKLYINNSINEEDIQAIENVQSILGSNLVSNYEEKIQPNIYYSVGIKFRLMKHINIKVSKTWSTIKNKITYTYLDTYNREKESEFSYDPISLSAQIYF